MISILGIIIADDEKKICRLLEYLIDWDEIGVKLLGVAYDGISAFQLIQEKKPDVLLTDIRMPGMDGLQLIEEAKKQNASLKCIIISGYKDFQYAQQGIRYGVRDYLLKPINQDDLTRTLKKLVKETLEQKSSQEVQMHLEETIRNYSGEFKRVFLKMVLEQKPEERPESVLKEVRKINPSRVVNQGGRCLVVKPDIEYKDFTKDAYQLLIDKTIEILQVEFASEEGDLTIEASEEGIFLLLFHEPSDKEELMKALNHVRDRVMGLQDLFPKIYFSAIITEQVDTDEELIRQIQYSRIAMYNRLLTDANTVSKLNAPAAGSEEKSSLTAEISRLLEDRPESFEPEEIKSCLNDAKRIMQTANNISGLDIKMELLRLAHNYLDWFELLDTSLDKNGKAAYFSEMYEHCISLEQAFELLEETLTKALLEVLSHLKSREIKPVAYAKHYIEKNKGVQIKLEELAKNAGFSYTYFSYLFKKETGKTLTEYIQMVRIEAAKKLLVEKERNVSEVAELVGYSDIKFFTKQFKKALGVSPNEYRKMFLER
ncbi:two-component system, response regulator YesN [Lacrimispora sphenoides]|jgi:two-component system response regulator YesN|uniref:response regulator transcription factor n=1 Tax=Lacrimispora sphenoides TaxID=29370 RepID=UPI0008B16E02|nr:response regulator [Lacrimispora sphenoides]SET76206.1 two-component system, response regulator YesN [Lacrimispora sphenoides]